MRALLTIVFLLALLPLEVSACNALQRAQFDCYERSVSMQERCSFTSYQNHVCAGQSPEIADGDIGKRCVVCWDRTAERARNGSRRDNSGRVIGKNLSEREAQRYSHGVFGATGE